MAFGFFGVLTQSQVEDVHRAALRVFHGAGIQMASHELLTLLGEFGGEQNVGAERTLLAAAWVEQFIADSDEYGWSCHQPSFGCHAGMYQVLCLDPETDEPEHHLRAIIARAVAANAVD